MSTRAEIPDLRRNFTPLPTQARFLLSNAKGRLLSSGYGGGKSKVGCRESIRYAVTYPQSRNMVARLAATKLRVSTAVTFRRELAEMGFVKGRHYQFNEQTGLYRWWNGSETQLSHLEDEEALGSTEWNTIFVDEGSEVPDSVYKILYPFRLRWRLPSCASDIEHIESRCGCPRRMWVCTNPGASGFLKMVVKGQIPDWEWFPVPAGENVYQGKEELEKQRVQARINGEAWYKRYVEGSWDAFEGQRFPMFDRERHVLAEPFRPGPRHQIFVGMDFGWANPTHVVWLAVDRDGEEPVVCFHEYVATQREVKDHAEEIRRVNERYGIDGGRVFYLGDPEGAAKKLGADSTKSVALQFSDYGIPVKPCFAGKSPFTRADHIAEFLIAERLLEGERRPALLIRETCPQTIESIVGLRMKDVDGRMGEDPREVFLDKDKHGFDALGYALIVIPSPDTPARPVVPPPRELSPHDPRRRFDHWAPPEEGPITIAGLRV